MPDSNHTVRAFDTDLHALSDKIAQMGGMAESMVFDAVSALVRADESFVDEVRERDAVLDRLQREIDEKAVLIIARRQPMAQDLREIIGAMRIAADLERVGDLGKSIAKRVSAISRDSQPRSFYRGLEALAELALSQLKDVLDSYASRSVERIPAMRDRDEEIDSMYTSLFRELLTYMMEDPRNISPCTHLLFCAKNIERIGDHATNVAETVYFIATGRQLDAERPKDDDSHKVVYET
ncbi:phosphate transport system regulatory protein PhoU [Zhengella mangrovi]|uniref:Phosphate-specific transport system accessory protein PhoU n=1 Tax=Zhengella mangrovi TaxID=1982044 RepID=A0A2G1QJ47_9HYPH|nr:phosphate signaling complex protein PhoU [Zhengella mangrovi]PHP65480.1 phosphate transport system regulatory protein PhoU [Zhengella mangrovi]